MAHGHSNHRHRRLRARAGSYQRRVGASGRHVPRMDPRQDRDRGAAHSRRPARRQATWACEAAQRCLRNAGVDKSAVDLIVVACATPDQSQPAVACLVQEKLGVAEGQCPAFDVNSVCAGFVFALNVAQGMMLAAPTQFRHALVIGADAFSKIMNWSDRRTCIFFGDGAGAVLLSQTGGRPAHPLPSGQRRARQPLHRGPGGRHPTARRRGGSREAPEHIQDGRPQGLGLRDEYGPAHDPCAAGRARSAPARSGSAGPAPEQPAHDRGDHDLARSCSMEQTVTTVETYGNTAAASIPLTLEKA